MKSKRITKAYRILEILTPFLEVCMDKYEADGEPTLPVTNDNKVNVAQLVKDLGLKGSDSQYFFKNRELAEAVNIVAEIQKISPIGSRALSGEADEAIRTKFAKMSRVSKKVNEELVDALHQIDALTHENYELKIEVQRLQQQIESIYHGGDILIRED